MAPTRPVLLAVLLIAGLALARPVAADGQLAVQTGPPPACLTQSLDPIYVEVDPLTCYAIVIGIVCFVIYTIAPTAICRDPLGIVGAR